MAFTIDYDRPILTISQVREWQKDMVRYADAIEKIQKASADTARKLDAAKIIMGELPDYQDDADESLRPPGNDEITATQDATSMVLHAIAAMGGTPRPGEIRDHLVKHNGSSGAELAGKAYFYTLLMRLTRTGRLIKEGDGYRLPSSSPQGEAGGVAPPADLLTSHSTDTRTDPIGTEVGGI